MTVGDPLDEGVAGASGRHRRKPLAYDRLEEAVLEGRRRRRRGPVDARRIEDHDLHPVTLGLHQLLGMLLGALVGGPLRVVGEHRLVEPLTVLGVEHVVSRGVEEASHPRPLRRGGERAAAQGVHLIEDPLVFDPLLRHPHRVEHQLASVDRGREALRISCVTADRFHSRGQNARREFGVPDQGPHLFAPIEK
jgi:hypothetical protein